MNNAYPTNMTDSRWNTILAILDDKRKRKHSLREILMQSSYMLKTGCQWGVCFQMIFQDGNWFILLQQV